MTVIVDANLTPSLEWRLAPILKHNRVEACITTVVKVFGEGVEDEAWLSEVAKSRWLPITNDDGRRGPGRRLPDICAELKLVHVTVSDNVRRAGASDLALAIAGVWAPIVEAWTNPVCTRYSLHYGPNRRPTLSPRPARG